MITSPGKKVKELRLKQNSSQEELAEAAQLSLRTIQRIESGESEPRGDTLKRLAKALNVTVDELTGETEKKELRQDKTFLILINLSALSFMIFPLLGIIVPLMIWMAKRDEIQDMNETGKKILNFQISVAIVQLLIFASISTMIFNISEHSEPRNMFSTFKIIMVSQLVLGLYNVVMIVINAIRISNGDKAKYVPALRFLG
ncbi:MAG TPA: helix-turn-helix domain-containing protein [Sphingobacteriaceae bacterium]